MSTMHKAADSPVTAAKQNSELHLIRELKKVHQDKEDAFRQVVRLREQIQKLQKHHDMMESQKANGITPELQQLVEIADRNGDRAALRWAREQASSSKGQNPKVWIWLWIIVNIAAFPIMLNICSFLHYLIPSSHICSAPMVARQVQVGAP